MEEKIRHEAAALSEEALEGVTGGAGSLGEEAISWDDPRCEKVASRARTFGSEFQDCVRYSQEERDRVKALCEELRQYVHTPEHFDLVKAMRVFIDLTAKTHVHEMTIAADAGWKILTQAVNNVLQ